MAEPHQGRAIGGSPLELKPDAQHSIRLQPVQLYDTLPLIGAQCIRILAISKETDDPIAPLRCTLQVVDLRSSPKFRALSYVWGKFSPVKDIISCNGVDVPVTRSCYDALHAIRGIYGATTIWVDAICIHQGDDVEKAVQIPLMREIFTMAEAVYIWLGPGTAQTDKAIRWLSAATKYQPGSPGIPWVVKKGRRAIFRDQVWYILQIFRLQFIQSIPSFVRADILGYPDTGLKSADLDSLLNRDWHLRAWTFQEIVLASNPIIICGSSYIKWAKLQGGLFISGDSLTRDRYPLWNIYTDHSEDSPAVVAWKRLFQIWLSTARPSRWDDVELRSQASIDEWSVKTYVQEAIGVPCLEMLEYIAECWFYLLQVFFWVEIAAFLIDLVTFTHLETNFFFGLLIFSIATHAASQAILLFGSFLVSFMRAFRTGTCIMRAKIRNTRTEAKNVPDTRHKGKYSTALTAIIQALRERQSLNPKDKSFALHGVLHSLGVTLSTPNYDDSLGQVYRNLLNDLLSWHPALINLLIDIGPTLPGSPSWVPDWSTANERSWLPAKYIYDAIGRDIEAGSDLHVAISGDELTTAGVKIGSLTFVAGTFERLGVRNIKGDKNGPSSAVFLRTLDVLCHWIKLFQKDGTASETYDSITRPVYEVLRGQIVDQAAKEVNPFHERLRVLVKQHPLSSYPDQAPASKSRHEVARATLEELKLKPLALRILVDLINGMVGKRGIFFSVGRLIGSAPIHATKGDDILIIRGVAVPMIARRQASSDAPMYTLIGPAFVGGHMDLLDFDPRTKSQNWKNLRFR